MCTLHVHYFTVLQIKYVYENKVLSRRQFSVQNVEFSRSQHEQHDNKPQYSMHCVAEV